MKTLLLKEKTWGRSKRMPRWRFLSLAQIGKLYLELKQAGRQNLAAGGPKTRRRGQKPEGGGHIFKIQYWMYAATGRPNVKWGGTDFKWGGREPLAPPLATVLSLSEIYMLIKRAHWAFYWPYACINLSDVWTVNLLSGAWHMFRLITFCISNQARNQRGQSDNCPSPKFSQMYVFVRYSNKLHHFPPP